MDRGVFTVVSVTQWFHSICTQYTWKDYVTLLNKQSHALSCSHCSHKSILYYSCNVIYHFGLICNDKMYNHGLVQVGGGHPTTTGNVINSSHVIPASLKRESQAAYYSGQACTSIVAQDETGSTIHGRNLDWNLPDDLRNMTSLVHVIIDNQCRNWDKGGVQEQVSCSQKHALKTPTPMSSLMIIVGEVCERRKSRLHRSHYSRLRGMVVLHSL